VRNVKWVAKVQVIGRQICTSEKKLEFPMDFNGFGEAAEPLTEVLLVLSSVVNLTRFFSPGITARYNEFAIWK